MEEDKITLLKAWAVKTTLNFFLVVFCFWAWDVGC